MTNKPLKDWEIDFDDKFHCGQEGCNCADGIGSIVAVKEFIEKLLSQTKSQIVEQILWMVGDDEEVDFLDFETAVRAEARNQIRKEIKEEINKL